MLLGGLAVVFFARRSPDATPAPAPPAPAPPAPPAERWAQLEALHAYDLTVDVLEASNLETLKAAVFPMLGAVLAAPMTAAITGAGSVHEGRSTTRVRLGLSILAGGQRVQLDHELARESVGAIWIVRVDDKGLFGLGGG